MPRTARLPALAVVLGAAGAVTAGFVTAPSSTPSTAADIVPIPVIQGSHHLSSYVEQEVITRGIVTARKYDGYWLQDRHGDGNRRTSDGIYVYTGRDGVRPEVGALVRLEGTVDEYRPGSEDGPNLNATEIVRGHVTVLDEQQPLPEPVLIGPGGRKAPAQNADSVRQRTDIETPVTTFLAERDALDFYETMEGMRVEVRDAHVVGPTNAYGELVVVPDGVHGLPSTVRGGVRYGSYRKPNTARLTIDDEIIYRQMPAADVGDTLSGAVVGPLSYDFGTVRLYPTSRPTVTDSGLQREQTRPAGQDELAVATFNVENLDPADPATKFDTIARTIVDNLAAPDVITLEEVQDNSGAECPDGPNGGCSSDGVVAADQTLDRLVRAIGQAGGPTYDWRQVSPENLADGGQPTGNIRVAFLFRTDRGLSFVDRAGGDATTPTEVERVDGRAQLTLSPGRIEPGDPAWRDSRKPLAGEFEWRGESVLVIANHFSSKGGDEPLTGRWQPPQRPSEEQRHAQARVLNSFVQQVLEIQPDANVVVAGDVNDFEFSRTTELLEAGKALVDLPQELPRRERYSYVYQGNSQVLDHILLAPATEKRLRSYDVVHVNAEFADQVSDHDPQVVRLALR